MHFLDLTLPTPEANLALDEALLLQAEAGQGGEGLRLWELPTYAVVLGAGGKLADDVDEAHCLVDAVPILRRASGGGTVLLGPGCLVYSLVLALDRSPSLLHVRPSYHYVLEHVCTALGDLVPGVERAGVSDLGAAGRKFSGNAQQRKQRYLLHHGTLLYAFDLAAVGRYLRLPERQPVYRAGRCHAAFLQNLPTGRDKLCRRLAEMWNANTPLTNWPAERTEQLANEKYRRPEWTRRR